MLWKKFFGGGKVEKKFKASELVRITGYSRKSIDLWLKNGKFSVVVEGGRKYVTVSELLRVFPEIKLEALEEKSSSLPEQVSTNTKQVENSEELLLLKTRIVELEAQNKYLEKLVAIYEEQIKELRTDKEVAEQHHRDIVSVVELLKRGLPLHSSTPRKRTSGNSSHSTPPQRDAYGRFVRASTEAEIIEAEEVLSN